MGNQVGFYFKSDWLRKQRELSEPITWRSKQNQRNSGLLSALDGIKAKPIQSWITFRQSDS